MKLFNKPRWAMALLAACVALPAAAGAETAFSGTVTASQTHVVTAPYGGAVNGVSVRAGDSVKIGDGIAEILSNKTYASVEGTVSGVFAAAGDSAEGVIDRYGAILYLEPVNRFSIAASTEKAYNTSENRYVHIGEVVYLSCTKDGSHQGRGIVTALDAEDDAKFTVEVTAGEFYMDETADIFRSPDYDAKTRIGRGTVGRSSPVAVKGEGSVLRMHVRSGDRVERGELLFETVTGTLDGLYAPDTRVVSDVQGVVASVEAKNGATVEKGATLATVYPQDSLQVQMEITEADLVDVHVGSKAEVEFNWNMDGGERYPGTVSAISYVSEEETDAAASGGARYVAYVDFTPDETVRIGMTVVVYVFDGDAADDTADDGAEEGAADDDEAGDAPDTDGGADSDG